MGVVGINSRSFAGVDNYSIVSCLGKALDVLIDFEDLEVRNDSGEVIPLKNTTLRQLAKRGVVNIV